MGNCFPSSSSICNKNANKMSVNIDSNEYIDGRKGMGGKRIIHRIIFVRHAETEGNNKKNNESTNYEKTHNTILTENGHKKTYNFV